GQHTPAAGARTPSRSPPTGPSIASTPPPCDTPRPRARGASPTTNSGAISVSTMTTRITAGFAAFAFAGLGAAGTAWADPADETENGQQQIEDGAQQSPQPSKSQIGRASCRERGE